MLLVKKQNIMVDETIKDEELESVDDIVEEKDADGNDLTDWKSLALKNQGIAKRYKTKLEKSKEVKPEVKPEATPEPVKSGELDYGQKAYLVANGIKEADEVALVKEVMQSTGKSLDDIVANKHFQAELQDLRDKKTTAEATPSGSKRANQSAKDSVEYWVNKKDSDGNLELPTDRELRTKVVNARITADKNRGQFYNG